MISIQSYCKNVFSSYNNPKKNSTNTSQILFILFTRKYSVKLLSYLPLTTFSFQNKQPLPQPVQIEHGLHHKPFPMIPPSLSLRIWLIRIKMDNQDFGFDSSAKRKKEKEINLMTLLMSQNNHSFL